MTSSASRRKLASFVVLALTAASAAAFYLLSVALAAQPPARAFEGWIGVIAPKSSLNADVQVRVTAYALTSGPADMAYGLTLCGSSPFTGYFLIGDDARLDETTVAASSESVEKLPDSTLSVQVLADGTTEHLRSVQVFQLTFDRLPACLDDHIASQTYAGTGFRIQGRAQAPVVSSTPGPIRGATERWSMPYVGSFPGQKSLGVFRVSGGIEGDFIQPVRFAAVVDAGSVPMHMDLDQARPETTDESHASWYLNQPGHATATIKDSARAATLQRLLAMAAVCFGILGSMFAAIALDWLRPPPKPPGAIVGAGPAPVCGRAERSSLASRGGAVSRGRWIAVAIALVGSALIGRRRDRNKKRGPTI